MIECLAALQFAVVEPVQKPRRELGRDDLALLKSNQSLEQYSQTQTRRRQHRSPCNPIRWWRVAIPCGQPALPTPRQRDRRFDLLGEEGPSVRTFTLSVRFISDVIIGRIVAMRIIGTDTQADRKHHEDHIEGKS